MKLRIKRLVTIALIGLVSFIVILLLGIRLLFGGGEVYMDVSTDPLISSADLEVLVELDYPPGNVTSSPGGRLFFNIHPFAQAFRFGDRFVFEYVDGESVPYPDLATQEKIKDVFGMTADNQGRLWMISPASIERSSTKLFAVDLSRNALVYEHEFEPGVARFAQDLRVSPDGKTIYMADTGAFAFTSGAIVVFDIESRRTRSVLQGHHSILPQDWVIQTANGDYKLAYGLVTFSVGVDGLAVSKDGQWLYYATMNHDTLYRIETALLLDTSATEEQLAAGVQPVGVKPLSDGIEMDAANNVYITDIENGGIAVVNEEGILQTLVKEPSVVWADGVTLTPDSSVVFTDSAIPSYIMPLLNPPTPERLENARPYRIYRFSMKG